MRVHIGDQRAQCALRPHELMCVLASSPGSLFLFQVGRGKRAWYPLSAHAQVLKITIKLYIYDSYLGHIQRWLLDLRVPFWSKSSTPSHVSMKILFWNKVHAAWSVYSNDSIRYISLCIISHMTQNKIQKINNDFRARANSGHQLSFFPRPPK